MQENVIEEPTSAKIARILKDRIVWIQQPESSLEKMLRLEAIKIINGYSQGMSLASPSDEATTKAALKGYEDIWTIETNNSSEVRIRRK